MNTAQQLEFAPIEHVDHIFSILIDGWTLMWWGVILTIVSGAWWFVRRRRSAKEWDGS